MVYDNIIYFMNFIILLLTFEVIIFLLWNFKGDDNDNDDNDDDDDDDDDDDNDDDAQAQLINRRKF